MNIHQILDRLEVKMKKTKTKKNKTKKVIIHDTDKGK